MLNKNEFDHKQSFILSSAERAYEQENSRQKAILGQSQRLLSLQTILITAISFVAKIGGESEYGDFLKYVIFIAILFMLLSLIFNLVAQWGYRYKGFPSPRDLEEEVDVKLQEKHMEFDLNVEYSALMSMWEQLVSSIRKNNKTRSLMLLLSMSALFVSIALFAVFSFLLIL